MRCTSTLLDPKLITCDKTVDLGQCSQVCLCGTLHMGVHVRGTAQHLSPEHEKYSASPWQRVDSREP